MDERGRLSDSEMDNVVKDTPSIQVAAMLTKQDEILAKLNEILASVETATDAASLYTELSALDLSVLSDVELI